MRNLADTLSRLKHRASGAHPASSRLEQVAIVGPNPGGLKAHQHVPTHLDHRPALVVVLHGCTQTAAAYDAGSGWSSLADRHGFVVLYPEQQPANNPGRCFNWYARSDVERGRGEAASIRSAIETVVLQHDIDRSRIFVTGLSAGGAMATAMLATYPEIFAGGAVIAGLPYGSAASVPEAFDRMRGHGLAGAAASTAAVLTASGHAGPWPPLSIWHGDADQTVAAVNADALVAQWVGVHDLQARPDEVRHVAGHIHRLWRGAGGEVVVEDYRIAGMGHGVPIDTHRDQPCGAAGPYFLEAGLSASRTLVTRWKLAKPDGTDQPPSPEAIEREPRKHETAAHDGGSWEMTPSVTQVETVTDPAAGSIQGVIEDALRRAGLMR